MEAFFYEPISHVMCYRISDLYEDILELIDSITFARKTISQQMWTTVFPVLCEYYMNGTMGEYLGDLLPCFDNIISYGHVLVSSNPQIQAMFTSIIDKAMKSTEYEDDDRIAGCQIMGSMLLCCRGSIDQLLPMFINLSLENFRKYKSKSSIVHHMEVILNCIIYDTMLTLKIFSANSASLPSLSDVLLYIVGSKAAFNRVHDKRVIVVAMNQLLRCNVDLSSICSPIFALLQDAFETLPKSLENRRLLEHHTENDDNDDANGEECYSDSYEDKELSEDDEGTHPQSSSQEREQPEALQEENVENEEADSEWEESDLEEELYYETPLDGVNLYELAVSTISGIMSTANSL